MNDAPRMPRLSSNLVVDRMPGEIAGKVEDGVRFYDVLNFGAGTQSTLMYLVEAMIFRGETGKLRSILEPNEYDYFMRMPRLDCAIFGDTQGEPRDVYKHLQWLKTIGGPPIIEATAGNLKEILLKKLSPEEHAELEQIIRDNRGIQDLNDFASYLKEKHDGQQTLFRNRPKKRRSVRFTSIPAYTASGEGKKSGITRRQCTKEFKIEVVEMIIKRMLFGVEKKKRVPNNLRSRQYFGFSADEGIRVAKTRERFLGLYWSSPFFPLFDLGLDRQSVISLSREFNVPHEIPRSACVYCPFRKNIEWRDLRDNDPEGWKEACEVDRQLREPHVIANIGMSHALYLHESCVPLAVAPIDKKDSVQKRSGETLEVECEGACGN